MKSIDSYKLLYYVLSCLSENIHLVVVSAVMKEQYYYCGGRANGALVAIVTTLLSEYQHYSFNIDGSIFCHHNLIHFPWYKSY